MKIIRYAAAALCACFALSHTAMAEEQDLGEAVLIELNAVKSNENSCTLSFFILNGHAVEIEKAVYETVLFDAGGQVDRLTLFDFGTLPPGRPRVRQFSVPGLTCDGLSQVLFNGAHTCAAEGLAEAACETDLELKTRTGIEVTG